jgi:hypothetical protein
VTVAADHPAEPGRLSFADASPAQIRGALTREVAASFDRQWRELMSRATERLDLTEVHEALDAWRQVAWVTWAHGADVYRRTLASARQRLRTGERADGVVARQQLEVELGLSVSTSR